MDHSDTDLPPDGFDEPCPKSFFGVLHDNIAKAAQVVKDVM
jgi:hypothetical protein